MSTETNLKVWLVILTLILITSAPTFAAKIIYVDDNAAPPGDGSSWEDAYNYLQDALADANSAIKPIEIRVAQGTYRPDEDTLHPDGTGDREATFQIINGVTIKGGYAGFGEPDPNARDIDLYETILNGDLVGDDGPALFEDFMMCCTGFNEPTIPFLMANNYSENSYHVVTGSGTDETAVLDGLTVTAGNSEETYPHGYNECGGGIYNYYGSPTLNRCTLTFNFAGLYGGAMYNNHSSPTLTNCKFYGNSVIGLNSGSGGGMHNHRSNPTLTDCTFERNWVYVYEWELYADGGGMSNVASNPILIECTFIYNWSLVSGGMYNRDSSPTLSNCKFIGNTDSGMCNDAHDFTCRPILNNCTFIGNSAHMGGAMKNYSYGAECNPMIAECVFINNRAIGIYPDDVSWGGAIYNSSSFGECSPRFTNCVFAGNAVVGGNGSGGAIFCTFASPNFSNCTFAANRALSGNVLACDSYPPFYQPSNVKLTNCILWDGGNEIWNDDGSDITIKYSDVQNGWPGEGNIDKDPCFVAIGYWEPNCISGDDYYYCTYDWIDGDYHLLPDSLCIDAGDPNYPYDPNETDLDGKPRVIGGRIDMGAYEYSPPIPAEVRFFPKTINLKSKVKWIVALLRLPEGYKVADIDPNSIFLENEIEPVRFWLTEDNQIALIKFNREEVQSFLDIGEIDLTITGQLTDGTIFEGTDIIKVTDKAGKKPAKER